MTRSDHGDEVWAEEVTLGLARFGILEGGPCDGRCYPLLDGTPSTLHVPDRRHTWRYVLRAGRYRFAGEAEVAPAA
jgi:hypothetical protein